MEVTNDIKQRSLERKIHLQDLFIANTHHHHHHHHPLSSCCSLLVRLSVLTHVDASFSKPEPNSHLKLPCPIFRLRLRFLSFFNGALLLITGGQELKDTFSIVWAFDLTY